MVGIELYGFKNRHYVVLYSIVFDLSELNKSYHGKEHFGPKDKYIAKLFTIYCDCSNHCVCNINNTLN